MSKKERIFVNSVSIIAARFGGKVTHVDTKTRTVQIDCQENETAACAQAIGDFVSSLED